MQKRVPLIRTALKIIAEKCIGTRNLLGQCQEYLGYYYYYPRNDSKRIFGARFVCRRRCLHSFQCCGNVTNFMTDGRIKRFL